MDKGQLYSVVDVWRYGEYLLDIFKLTTLMVAQLPINKARGRKVKG